MEQRDLSFDERMVLMTYCYNCFQNMPTLQKWRAACKGVERTATDQGLLEALAKGKLVKVSTTHVDGSRYYDLECTLQKPEDDTTFVLLIPHPMYTSTFK